MTQAFTAPVSGAAQAGATRTARTSAGGSGPPGADNETPAFSSVLDHHVARTAHAEGQHKTTGDSGGRRSSHGHGAGKGHHSHKSASAGSTTRDQATSGAAAVGRRHHRGPAGDAQANVDPAASVTLHADVVRAATPAIEQPQADTNPAAQSALVSPPPTSAVSSASNPADAAQATAGDTTQSSNFIPAAVKPAPASVAAATPGVQPTAADELSAADEQDATDQAPLTASTATATAPSAAEVIASTPQTTQPTGPQTTQADASQTTQADASQASQADAPQASQPVATAAPTPPASDAPAPTTPNAPADATTAPSPTRAGDPATTASGQASAPTAKHSAKTAGPGAAAHGDTQADAPTTTSATAQPQAPSAGTQDPGQNGGGGEASGQTPPHPEPSATQPQAVQPATPARAANTPTPPAEIAATPVPQVSAAASTAATAATAAATGPARYGVGLSEAVETVKTTIELGSRQGFSQAKIQLAPATLGQITIHLQKTSDGIVAKVIADHSAAAQTMQQGGDDLRRSLQNSGLHLLRLDIETRGDQRGSANAGGHTSQSQRTGGDQESASAGDDGASQPTTIVLPNGALVNVLA
jgi:flagellar hook-length control protein FliK